MKNINDIIEQTVNATIIKLKKERLIQNEKTAFKKTEEILKSYNDFLKAIDLNKDSEKTKKLVMIINKSLKQINQENKEYAGLLEDIYFKNMTREELAFLFGCEPITITRNKNKMINRLKNIIFSDDVIRELFF